MNAGIVVELSDAQQRELLREIYQLASVLTHDFRRVEDEIRELDQSLRVEMIESGNTRGDVLTTVLEKENMLSQTDAGSAFESFFHLLCDENRSTEFRNQLQNILAHKCAKHLPKVHRQYLSQLMRELTKESERVFKIRSRTEESLRAYIESGALFENLAVERLLSQLERHAIELKNQEISIREETTLSLPVGPIELSSIDRFRLKSPEEPIETSNITPQINQRTPNANMLACLEGVTTLEVAHRIHRIVNEQGPLTLTKIAATSPITMGLEELVAFLRVAKAVNATDLGDQEEIEFVDRHQTHLKARTPRLLVSPELFPESVEELTV